MYFQIQEIILWPRKKNLKPIRLPFELGKVNVISGASRTGKSAIIPIIDYCLGADKCAVPVKTIRDSCEWFGVLVQTREGQKLFARREPGEHKSTGDMFVVEAVEVVIPEQIKGKNTSVDAVKHTLDELAGLTTLDFDVDDIGAGYRGRPSFRDMSAFNFQPQNIVANPDILFYKSNSAEHREKLRTIFPYVLNAVTPNILALQHELTQLKKELLRKEREFNTIRDVSARWLAEIRSRVMEAKELGLVAEDIPVNASKGQLISIMMHVVESSGTEGQVTLNTINDAVDELVNLQKEETDISLELSALRKRYSEMSKLKESTAKYGDALQIQRERLNISGWIGQLNNPEHDCPICGQALTSTVSQLAELKKALGEIEETAGNFFSIPTAFDRELERVRAEISKTTEKLEGIKIRRRALEKSSDAIKRKSYEERRVSRFIGSLEESINTFGKIGEDQELAQEIDELRRRVDQLMTSISEGQIKARLQRALEKVSGYAGKLVPRLDVERPDDPVSLSLPDLTIKVKGIDREDYLWEIGSGSNWLSYHVAVSLALLQYFLSLSESPVPAFIVYDQPSQVYFPKLLTDRGIDEQSKNEPQFKDEDVIAVRKVFSVLSSVIFAAKGDLQVIVLDHAAENVWGELDNLHLVEEWRDGKKLIPNEWLA